MTTIKRKFTLALLITVFLTVKGISGNHTVQATVEVTETAMNRYLKEQYNAVGFPSEIPVSGTNYKIYLTMPEISLTIGNAKLYMMFYVKDGPTLLHHFVVQPSINIPSSQISAMQIQAFLTNLQTTLDAVTPALPSWVKTNIIANFDTRGWTVYPSRLLDTFSSQWFKERGLSISINDLALGWQVEKGVLKLTISIPMTASVPIFYADVPVNNVRIKSAYIDVIVDEVRLYPLTGSTPIKTWTDDVILSKNVSKLWSVGYDLAPTNWVLVWVLFRTENTFYVRKFKCRADGSYFEEFASIN